MPQIRLNTHDADVWIIFFHPSGKTHEGSAGPQSSNHHGHLSIGLLPDLRGGSKIVGLPVCGIIELIGHKIGVGVFPGQAIDLFNGAVGSQMSGGQQNIRPPRL